jgi:hypothetical protein
MCTVSPERILLLCEVYSTSCCEDVDCCAMCDVYSRYLMRQGYVPLCDVYSTFCCDELHLVQGVQYRLLRECRLRCGVSSRYLLL